MASAIDDVTAAGRHEVTTSHDSIGVVGCPSEQSLVDFVEGFSGADRRTAIDAHIDGCARCQTAVAELAGASDPLGTLPQDLDDVPTSGVVAERYVLRRTLGAGAMGTVYAAYDRRLDRTVALKVLRAAHGPSGSWLASRDSAEDPTRGWMQAAREGRVLARLSHPNIVAVYDVGAWRQRVFVAMELVEGETLRARLHSGAMGWKAAIGVLLPAADALAAAHAHGVVHRDFKPDNMMIGADAIKVLDFGLSRGEIDELPAGVSRTLPHSRTGEATRHTIAGSPAYMAPETLRGASPDPAGDQYAFFVTLYEAIAGRRPFSGRTLAEQRREKARSLAAGTLAWPPDCPRWLRRAISRGLAADPRRRFRDMNEVASTLRGSGRRQGWVVAAVGLLGIGGVLASIVASDDVAICSAAADHVDPVWGAARRERISAALGQMSPRRAEAIVAQLDDLAAQWQRTYESACRATQVQHTRTTAQLDASMACLFERLAGLRTLVEVLDEHGAGPKEFDAMLGVLEPAAECAQAEATEGERNERAYGRQVQALARARIFSAAGRRDKAAKLAAGVARAADDAGWVELSARATFAEGIAAQMLADFPRARDRLRAAYFSAGRANRDDLAAEAAGALAYAVGYGLEDPETGLEWVGHMRAALRRAGDDPDRSVRLATSHGMLLDLVGRHEEALAEHRRALELAAEGTGAKASAHTNLSRTLSLMGRSREAYEHAAAAVDVRVRLFGEDHPDTVIAHYNHIQSLQELGRTAEALESLRSLMQQVDGDDAMPTNVRAAVTGGFALAQRRAGNVEEAIALYRRAIDLQANAYGVDHVHVAPEWLNLSTAHQEAGDCESALSAARRAAEIWQRHVPDGLRHLQSEYNVALMLACLERHEDALQAIRSTLAKLEDDPTTHPLLSRVLHLAAVEADALGRTALAIPWFERARETATDGDFSEQILTEIDVRLREAGVGVADE